ncbi:hypothetical protein HBB16_03865 [Pseudonocardia sp. MCCB 268]|nr:hypothetical protein [Pseudonocardia cytotoxica]
MRNGVGGDDGAGVRCPRLTPPRARPRTAGRPAPTYREAGLGVVLVVCSSCCSRRSLPVRHRRHVRPDRHGHVHRADRRRRPGNRVVHPAASTSRSGRGRAHTTRIQPSRRPSWPPLVLTVLVARLLGAVMAPWNGVGRDAWRALIMVTLGNAVHLAVRSGVGAAVSADHRAEPAGVPTGDRDRRCPVIR